jgi:hypothetical protein
MLLHSLVLHAILSIVDRLGAPLTQAVSILSHYAFSQPEYRIRT